MKKILYFVAEDSYFYSHRISLALAAKDKGAEIIVVTRVSQHGELIKKAGFRVIPLLSFNRSKLNFWHEVLVLKQLFSVFLKEKPSVVHNIAMKPVLYGSLVARLTGIPKVVNTLTGLGFLFTHNNRSFIKRRILLSIFKKILNKKESVLIVQNKDDYNIFKDLKFLDPNHLILIRGSGIDLKSFKASSEPDASEEISIAFVSRMLKDKGVYELVEAIRLLKKKNVKAKFIFCGDIDSQNPSSVTHRDLQEWHNEGLIEWRGHCDNIAEIYKNVHLAVLPSYREGLPKSLLEAASSRRAIVSTDVPGCREIVEHGVNGLLVQSKNPIQLAEALHKLIKDSTLRQSMGKAGRRIVEENFSSEMVIAKTMEFYGV